MGALTNDLTFVDDDAADLGIGAGEADGGAGEVQGALHELLVELVCHDGYPSSPSQKS